MVLSEGSNEASRQIGALLLVARRQASFRHARSRDPAVLWWSLRPPGRSLRSPKRLSGVYKCPDEVQEQTGSTRGVYRMSAGIHVPHWQFDSVLKGSHAPLLSFGGLHSQARRSFKVGSRQKPADYVRNP